MKSTLSISIVLTLMSCSPSPETISNNESVVKESKIDTTLVKIENKIDTLWEVGYYVKSFTYCWVANKDTLDFKIKLTEHVGDSSVELGILHRNPILFSKALEKINDCLPLIEQDFNLANLSSLYFEAPIFYKDMTIELSKSYENQFGNKNINHQEQDEFLLNSWLDKKVAIFLRQFDKSTRRYGIEKFHLMKKEHYNEYIPNEDLDDYPSFSIDGMGISVILNDKK